MYRNLDLYLRDLERELRLLPATRRWEIIHQLKGDYADREGSLADLPSPQEFAREFTQHLALVPAGFFRRVAAFVLDMAAMAVVVMLSLLAMLNLWPGAAGQLLVALTAMGMVFLYFPLLEGTFGKTLGKAITGVLVVREDGRPCGYGEAFLRRIPFWFNLFLIDGAFALFLAGGQRAFDRVARTLVVRDTSPQKTWLSLVGIGLVLAFVLSTGFAGYTTFRWLTYTPQVPASGSPETVLQNLVLPGLTPLTSAPTETFGLEGQAAELKLAGAQGTVTITAYRGDRGRSMMSLWTAEDRVKRMSRHSEFGQSSVLQYFTHSQRIITWQRGEWAFLVQADRGMSAQEFDKLVAEVSRQLSQR